MTTILVYTSPARGHLVPALGVASELTRRGHAVHVRTLADEVERIRDLGVTASAIHPAIEARQLDDWKAKNPLQALERAMATFADRAEHEVDDLRAAIAQTSAEALLVDTNCWGAQAMAEASGLPWATFQPYFTALGSEGVPPFGPGFAPAAGPLGRLRDRIVGQIVSRKMRRVALPGVNAPRRRLGLAPIESMDEFLTRPPRVIYFTAPELEYPRSHWPDTYRFVGPGTWSPPVTEPEWLRTVARPVALVTCSTERQEDRGILEAALDGLPEEGYFVVGTTGAFDPDELDVESTEHARVERHLPHDAILGRAEVVVCHGGMGITQRSLLRGVPLVVVPFGRDQLEVARRVERAGAGVRLMPKRLTPGRLAEAVQEARRLTEGAGRISEALQAAGGSAAAADAIEELLTAGDPGRVRPMA